MGLHVVGFGGPHDSTFENASLGSRGRPDTAGSSWASVPLGGLTCRRYGGVRIRLPLIQVDDVIVKFDLKARSGTTCNGGKGSRHTAVLTVESVKWTVKL